ncbi:hypothetical protein LAZ67_3002387 [Cordylochernes scorpioides]|uniref:CCHC-type domain-containing protein n=1 Tax=Cordylochernes scorpioides TaxID=51811 RepID=A0ABY6K7Y6_9ARAC|nr:hypothetical protein LAZ67_3002387 [Cordylochernes scorpioides]
MDKLKKACETKKRTLESVIAEADGELEKQEPSLEMLMSLRPKLLRCKDRFLIASDCLIEQLIKADREDEEIEDVDIVQANLFGRSEGVLQKMEQLLAKPTVDRESIVSGGNEGKSNLHRLPKLELPKFGGQAREWLQFWSAFQSVHDDDSISACVKFQYLQNCMIKGSVSEEIVSSFPNSAANYPLAISTLKERFGREDMLVEVYVRDLIAIILENAHGRNTTSFSTVYVRLSSQLRALGSLGVTTDKCAAILYPMVESALPEDLFVAWERTRHHHKPDEDGKHNSSEALLEKLMEFLKHEVEGSERMRLARQPFSSSYPSQFNRDKPPKPKTSVATAASLVVADGKSNNAYKCVFCDGKHWSEQCCKAMSMSLEARRKIIQEKQCCYSCLKPGHFSKYCRNVVKCVICSKKHRAILCPVSKGSQKSDGIEERSKNINASVDMSNQIRCQDVLLQTIMVKINGENKSKVVRAMLDSGSQNSYVLEQTGSEVGLTMLGKKEVVHLLFGGVKSRPQQHKRYRIYISDVDSKYNCNFEVQDCSTICSAMPSAQPTEWMTELRSKGIDLDVYRSNTEIELLLGADVYAKLLTGKKIELESGPVALETKLGWTVSGKVLGNVQTTKSQSSVLSCLVRDATIQDLRRLDVIGIMEPMKEKSKEELSVAALEHFNQTVKQNEDGRYSANLPWIGEHPPLPNYKLISGNKLESTTALAGIKRDMNWWYKNMNERSSSDWDGFYMAELKDQRVGESLMVFKERFLAIRDEVEYRFDDSLVFEIFLENVLDKYREAIVRSEAKSIDKAVSVMATEDSVEHRCSFMKGVCSVEGVEEINSIKGEMKMLSSSVNRMKHENEQCIKDLRSEIEKLTKLLVEIKMSPSECRLGHIASDCCSRQSSMLANRNTLDNAEIVNIRSYGGDPYGNLPIVKVNINGNMWHLLYDTGSQVSIIDSEKCKVLKENWDDALKTLRIVSVTDHEQTLTRVKTCRVGNENGIELGEIRFWLMSLGDKAYDEILGINDIRRFNIPLPAIRERCNMISLKPEDRDYVDLSYVASVHRPMVSSSFEEKSVKRIENEAVKLPPTEFNRN